MRHSIATMVLSGSLPEKMTAAAEAGFDAIELFENDLIQCDLSLTEIRERALQLNLKLDIYQPLRDFEGVSSAQLARNLDRAEHKFDVMQELGIDLLGVCSNAQADALGDRQLIADQLAELAQRAARRQLRIGFESLSWGTHCNRWSHAWEAVQRADQQNLGLILDSYHTLALRDDYSAIREIPGERIFYFQLSDAPFEVGSPPLYTRPLRTLPGLGQLDMVGFTDTVLQTGYRGPLSLEIFSDEYRGAPAGTTARGAKASLLWLEERVQERRLGRAEPSSPFLKALAPSPQLSPFSLMSESPEAYELQHLLNLIGTWSAESITQAVPASELETFSTVYRECFGTRRQTPILKHDPQGVIRGRTLFTDACAIELETSIHHSTLVASASKSRRFTRLTIAVPNLDKALMAIDGHSQPPLVLSAHYYNDLRARFALSEEKTNGLRKLNAAYDRQGDGELLQTFVPVGTDGFCLHVVERRPGYPSQSWDMANAYVVNAALKARLSI
ncbi:sugar phosphate isomerase/epimerase and 4-hydroxyphenylpyruvate domain-containing protein [Pseudomonas chlororaphis]|uniref:sugar phosphate isomerase/epimerase and 4-hydroxyphenylpyruvate domain-containing protein n=1 Tax=Pseudomonas chlororaphis TaxID=587753 RepID=UPI0003D2F131|nr:sugar phosphate isomerase/epimerase and 4-hydroxyphenylpyruvate domain-containing protein [Pseudomonas chlororaphis]AZD30514.1 4-hydroxyphenylpyruvate dioxygenase [Pseudomonas chlororaphis]ETD38826.1 4-hydroxyphenylpyruvate dioxygenase [Pseudomonas chlororaphis subsp. aurantiaca PB-St2]QFS55884.1 TIM barrel protein [Pseudomonas chlororaphis subsp. aurantiaca]